MLDEFKRNMKEYLLDNDVDIYDDNYKKTEAYIKIKDQYIYAGYNGFISLEEFIERYLLTKSELLDIYESIYDLGNPYELEDDECEDTALAEEIISVLELAKEYVDVEIEDFIENLYKKGGLIDRLKKYLDFDLEEFEKSNNRFNSERCKIIYFFYMMDHKKSKKNKMKINILMMLGRPSMENIDNTLLNMKTYNGMLVKSIKESFGKEISLTMKSNIKWGVHSIISEWDGILCNAMLLMDFLFEHGYEYDFEEAVYPLIAEAKLNTEIENTKKYIHSPIETMYLKILQNEALGNIIDINKVNNIQIESNYNVPAEFTEEMKQLNEYYIEINRVAEYINKNALRIAKYVYLGETDKEDVRRIREFGKKLPMLIEFCSRAIPLIDTKKVVTELLIISCLQAIILDDQNEVFDYTFHAYQRHMKQKPRVQAALKGKQKDDNKHVVDALKVYWVRKIIDHWYANIGRYDVRNRVRELEKACDGIIEEALTQSNLDDMLEIHNHYLMKVDDRLLTTKEQIQAAISFEKFLHSKGFKYIDHGYQIRYLFVYPDEITETYEQLTNSINSVLENEEDFIQATIEVLGANGEQRYELNFDLLFDYQNRECIMKDFKRHSI